MTEKQTKKRNRGHNEGTIRQRPDGLWEARITCGHDLKTGKIIRKSFYSKNKKTVKEKMQAALNDLKINGYVSNAKTFTVKEWLDHWIVTYKLSDSSSNTIQNLQNIINNYLTPLHNKKIDKVRPVDIQHIYNTIDTSNSTRMVEMTHSCLNNAYKYAIKLGYVNYNPTQATFLPKKKKKTIMALDNEQQAAFLKAVENNPYKNLLLFYLLTGLRRGELIALEWNDINLEKELISVTGAAVNEKNYNTGKFTQVKSKTKTPAGVRKIPIAPPLMEILLELQETKNSQYVFANDNGGMLPLDFPDKEFKRVCKKAELTGFTLHSLRHTFATRVYESGVKDKVNQMLMGHSTDTVTKQIYIHANEDFIIEESKKIKIIK